MRCRVPVPVVGIVAPSPRRGSAGLTWQKRSLRNILDDSSPYLRTEPMRSPDVVRSCCTVILVGLSIFAGSPEHAQSQSLDQINALIKLHHEAAFAAYSGYGRLDDVWERAGSKLISHQTTGAQGSRGEQRSRFEIDLSAVYATFSYRPGMPSSPAYTFVNFTCLPSENPSQDCVKASFDGGALVSAGSASFRVLGVFDARGFLEELGFDCSSIQDRFVGLDGGRHRCPR